MSFVDSASTVTVKAFLTAAGRKKLFDSLETVNDEFVTMFGLGDSDANYAAIEAGFGTLPSGLVPSPGEFLSNIRTYALYQGRYEPYNGLILVDGEYSQAEGHFVKFPIGDNRPRIKSYVIESEQPKKQRVDETYKLSASIDGAPLSITTASLFAQYFRWELVQLAGQDQSSTRLEVEFLGGMSQTELNNVIGPDSDSDHGWTFQVRLEGNQTGAVTTLNIDFVQ